MQFRDHDPTEEERSSLKAITEEYPSASRLLMTAFMIADTIGEEDKDRVTLMFGIELGLRIAISLDTEIIRQAIEVLNRGRTKLNNDDTSIITNMMATVVVSVAEDK